MHRRQLVPREANYQLIASHLYKFGIDGIMYRCVLAHEREGILYEKHEGVKKS